jgi:hypothetical protein
MVDEYADCPELEAEMPGIVEELLKKFEDFGTMAATQAHALLIKDPKPVDVDTFFVKLTEVFNKAERSLSSASDWVEIDDDEDDESPVVVPKKDKGKDKPRKTTPTPKDTDRPRRPPVPPGKEECKVCGGWNCKKPCPFLEENHPDANCTPLAWRASDAGEKAWAKGVSHLRVGYRIDGRAWSKTGGSPKGGGSSDKKAKKDKSRFYQKTKGECGDCEYLENLNATVVNSADHYTVPCELLLDNKTSLTVNALIDTGALQGNYIDLELAAKLLKAQQELQTAQRNILEFETQHTCTDCSKSSGLRDVTCFPCNNKVFENNEDFLLDQPGGTREDKKVTKRKVSFSTPGSTDISVPLSTEHKLPLSAEQKTSVSSPPNLIAGVSQVATRVCSAIKGMCTTSPGQVTVDFKYLNEETNVHEVIEALQARILDIPYEMIIGRPDIIKHDMLSKLNKHFSEKNVDVGRVPTRSAGLSTHDANTTLGQPSVSHDHPILSVLFRKEDLLTPEEDDDGIELKVKDYPWEKEDPVPGSAPAPKPQPVIEGSAELQAKIRKLLAEYDDIFSCELCPKPAQVSPLEIVVNLREWTRPKNRLPPRTQTRAKEIEIERQIRKMIANNVIRPSQAAHYSQVHLTPKPNGKWRFCIDYRALNEVCKAMGWPIPNIKEMLQRLGHKRAKFYAVMDLTSGYHQAPLSRNSQEVTAFITFMGVFEWLRVPMGLKGAPSYFQQKMAEVVLRGLLYHICELYLDDIIVHGNTEDEYLTNLRQVFERLRARGITLNPEKCRFGLSEVEYVGHIINENGLTFSPAKREQVLDFPLPKTQKQLKQFLGLANWFRDHVKNHSALVHPLQEMVSDYKKNKPLQWTPELEQLFEEVKQTVGNCPMLFFMDDKLPVFLHTDASDYDIGAYLFQKGEDGVEKPIAFISKSLARERLRWSVPEKEAYAIFYAFQKLEYLIRDIYFVLRTDHKNLTYINQEGSPKVRRWKLAIQEYNFDIDHIAGEDNVVADALSRLCAHTYAEEQLFLIEEDHIPKDKYKLIAKVHNSVAGHNGVEKR